MKKISRKCVTTHRLQWFYLEDAIAYRANIGSKLNGDIYDNIQAGLLYKSPNTSDEW